LLIHNPAPEIAKYRSAKEFKKWHGGMAASQLVRLVGLVPVFGFSIGSAAGCPQDAREKDCSDNGYDDERGRNHV